MDNLHNRYALCCRQTGRLGFRQLDGLI
jgi:hypothetical protein